MLATILSSAMATCIITQASSSTMLLKDLLVASKDGRLHEVQSLLDGGQCKVNDEDEVRTVGAVLVCASVVCLCVCCMYLCTYMSKCIFEYVCAYVCVCCCCFRVSYLSTVIERGSGDSVYSFSCIVHLCMIQQTSKTRSGSRTACPLSYVSIVQTCNK